MKAMMISLQMYARRSFVWHRLASLDHQEHQRD